MIVIGFCISLGVAAAIIAEPFIRSRMAKKKGKSDCLNYTDKRREEYKQRAEYNRAHLPSMELPPLAPDWAAVDDFIMKTRCSFTDEGYRFAYLALVNNSYETKYILKSDFDSDTLRLIELLQKDVGWFYANPTGVTLTDQDETLTIFLREKYSGLSERSISRISSTYCINNR